MGRACIRCEWVILTRPRSLRQQQAIINTSALDNQIWLYLLQFARLELRDKARLIFLQVSGEVFDEPLCTVVCTVSQISDQQHRSAKVCLLTGCMVKVKTLWCCFSSWAAFSLTFYVRKHDDYHLSMPATTPLMHHEQT